MKDMRKTNILRMGLIIIAAITTLFSTLNNQAYAIIDNQEYYELKFQREDLLAREQALLKDRTELNRELQIQQNNRHSNPRELNSLFNQLDSTMMELSSVRDELTRVEMDLHR